MEHFKIALVHEMFVNIFPLRNRITFHHNVEMSSRLQIVDCENGRSNGKPMKKQYDRTGHETGGGGAVGGHGIQPDHPTS